MIRTNSSIRNGVFLAAFNDVLLAVSDYKLHVAALGPNSCSFAFSAILR